jgi:hypothetical protein
MHAFFDSCPGGNFCMSSVIRRHWENYHLTNAIWQADSFKTCASKEDIVKGMDANDPDAHLCL